MQFPQICQLLLPPLALVHLLTSQPSWLPSNPLSLSLLEPVHRKPHSYLSLVHSQGIFSLPLKKIWQLTLPLCPPSWLLGRQSPTLRNQPSLVLGLSCSLIAKLLTTPTQDRREPIFFSSRTSVCNLDLYRPPLLRQSLPAPPYIIFLQ